ncbi:uncharacterized protein LOC121732507 isoform X1 [Aricia agestis]|uniref:uncharacterized protein LOC121732507 isoform X1 n=1 Tax=Aricia agestis TaxID=91739 RepID=UPI001C20A138|nr:uncharacterized protein LOC121732507 isoform X1 [Aricia agestis]
MVLCDKWVALKIVEFCFCVACLVTKRVSTDDEARLALLLQKLSREWSLLNSVTWDGAGSSFADAIYGGYVIITFALIMGRVFQEVPIGRRILEGILLGFGMLFFLILGGLELASLDSVPYNLTVNASVLGSLSLVVAALFLVDLMGPRLYTNTRYSQTDPIISPKPDKKVTILNQPFENGKITNGKTNEKEKNKEKPNGKVQNERPKTLDVEKEIETKTDVSSTENLKTLAKLEELRIEDELKESKFGSLRNLDADNYVRLADPLEIDRYHYETELAKFNEKYFSEYFGNIQERLPVREKYLPELQAPIFAKVKAGRPKSYAKEERPRSPTRTKTVPTPTLHQLEEYLKGSFRSRRGDTPGSFAMEPIAEKDHDLDGRASGTPTDPGYVQYTANKWPDRREVRTPRHSPTQ